MKITSHWKLDKAWNFQGVQNVQRLLLYFLTVCGKMRIGFRGLAFAHA